MVLSARALSTVVGLGLLAVACANTTPTSSTPAPVASGSGGRVASKAVPVPTNNAGEPSPAPSPAASPNPLTSPSPAASPDPVASPIPSPGSDPVASCPYGPGDIKAACSRYSGGAGVFLADVDAAINQLVKEKPELFDTTVENGPGEYWSKDAQAYVDGVVANLVAMGFCSQFDGDLVLLKKGNEFSEGYSILLSSGHIRRGIGSYRNTCTPASFPIDPETMVKKIRVSFYGYSCKNGRIPDVHRNELPMDCVGYVTATPKDANDDDVPASIHGEAIDWWIRFGPENIDVGDDARTPPMS